MKKALENELRNRAYDARDYEVRARLMGEFHDFAQNFADTSLDGLALEGIDEAIDREIPGLLADFAGFLLLGLCADTDGPGAQAVQARMYDLFTAGMAETDVHLTYTKEPVNAEPEWTPGMLRAIEMMRTAVHDAPVNGPDMYMELMGDIEARLDEFNGATGL